MGFKDNKCYTGRMVSYSRIYWLLTFNIGFDFYLNRRWFLKIGRKFCMSADKKQEFKRIKACKRQMKYARSQLDLLEMQMDNAKDAEKIRLKKQQREMQSTMMQGMQGHATMKMPKVDPNAMIGAPEGMPLMVGQQNMTMM